MWWTRTILRAQIIDEDVIRAQGFRSPRAALRAYVRGGFRRGVTLNPLAMERLIASQLSDVGRVPALYAYLVNDPRRIRASIHWDAVRYAEDHPASLADPGGPLGHRWREARAVDEMSFDQGGVTTVVSWREVVQRIAAAGTRVSSGSSHEVRSARTFVCRLSDDEADLAYALEQMVAAASADEDALLLTPEGGSFEVWLACTLLPLWRPNTSVHPADSAPARKTVARRTGVTVVRGPDSEIASAHLELLALAGEQGPVAPLWLDLDGTIASAGLIVRDHHFHHLLAGHPPEDALAAGEVLPVPRIAGSTFARPGGTVHSIGDRTLVGAVVRARREPPPGDFVDSSDTDLDDYLRPAGLMTAQEPMRGRIVRRPRTDAVSAGRFPRLRWAIKIAAPPGRPGEYWGDTHFARGLADALRRHGQDVIVDAYAARERATAVLDDVVLALRGPEPIRPQAGATSMMWIISHPDEMTADQLEGYDAVFAASAAWAETASRTFRREIKTLLQCTDPTRFHPHGVPRTGERVFVGTARGIARPSVVEPLRAGLQLSVYGPDWTGYIPAHAVVARSVPNSDLPLLYESADVVMNDHWPAMQRAGFVSNRLFDVVAAGGRAVSDDVAGIDDIFSGAVVTYRSIDELLTLLRRPSEAIFPSPAELSRISERIRRDHSFDARAVELLETAMTLRN
ncbi:glycosyltransferase family protein [Microbacterium sp. T32]|uniref:glycosyltransferase family protein n=1 Tax=Microbacterium sp. T32 TaxID=1776083 RepID=UPI0007ABA060|nr:glycosyltransferase [Microbacterium sp. T32]KZE36539.1 hypothetical protein AVW09_16740 [Microbacterium sp. T32]